MGSLQEQIKQWRQIRLPQDTKGVAVSSKSSNLLDVICASSHKFAVEVP